jgi:hypothetical protein
MKAFLVGGQEDGGVIDISHPAKFIYFIPDDKLFEINDCSKGCHAGPDLERVAYELVDHDLDTAQYSYVRGDV